MTLRKYLIYMLASLSLATLNACDQPSTPEQPSQPVETASGCGDSSCSRGVCKFENNAVSCVNAEPDTCQDDNDCVNQYYCIKTTPQSQGGSCLTQAEAEAALCKGRGILDVNSKKCVNPGDCLDDQECIQGNFCKIDHTGVGVCELNYCEEFSHTCNRGKCDPSQGNVCVNSAVCSENNHCLDGFACVNKVCKETTKACESVCKGNQVCGTDPSGSGVQCSENPDGCRNGEDCLESNICLPTTAAVGAQHTGLTCQAAPPCAAQGAHEPNDTESQAKELQRGSVDGKICTTDVDYYRTTYQGVAVGESMRVELSVDPKDVGNGELILNILYKEKGAAGDFFLLKKVSFTPTSKTGPTLTFDVDPGTSTKGYEILLKLTANSHFDYKLSASKVSEGTTIACRNAQTLTSGDTVTTSVGVASDPTTSAQLNTKCDLNSDRYRDNVYKIALAEKSYVYMGLHCASDTANPTISLRKSCVNDESEIGCSYPTGKVLESEVEAGEYYVVVQGEIPTTCELTYRAQPILCEKGSATCSTKVMGKTVYVATYCNANGTGYLPEVVCGTTCDDSTQPIICQNSSFGVVSPGDDCAHAIPIVKSGETIIEKSPYHSFTYNTNSRENCASTGNNQTTDVVARVDALKGQVIIAKHGIFDGTDTFDGAINIIKGAEGGSPASACGVDFTCLVSSDKVGNVGKDDPEKLMYEVEEDGTYFVIASAGPLADSGSGHKAKLSVEVISRGCTPGHSRCIGRSLEKCDDEGRGFVLERVCDTSCELDPFPVCKNQANDTCSETTAKELVLGPDPARGPDLYAITSAYLIDYSAAVPATENSCAGREVRGRDASYVIRGSKGDLYRFALTTDQHANLQLFLTTSPSCDLQDASSCLGTIAIAANSTPGVYTYRATSADPIYVVVKGKDHADSGSFTLDVTRQVTAVCDAGATACDGTDAMKRCNSMGTEWLPSMPCKTEGSCTADSCELPDTVTMDGNSCSSAMPLKNMSGDFTTSSDSSAALPGNPGACEFSDQDEIGHQKYMKVTIPAKHVLSLNYTKSMGKNMLAYLVEEGCNINTCKANSKLHYEGNFYYYNDSDKEFKGVVVLAQPKSNELTQDNDFRVSYDIYAPDCETIGAYVSCDDAAAEITMCGTGYKHVKRSCKYSCSDATKSCKTAPNDVCSGAVALDQLPANTKSIRSNIEYYTPQIDHGGVGSCDQRSSSVTAAAGRDAFYKYTAPADKSVILYLTLSSKNGDFALYALDEKQVVDSSDGSCLTTPTECFDGQDLDTGGAESQQAIVFIKKGETKYIVVDTRHTKLADANFTLQWSVRDAECENVEDDVKYTCEDTKLVTCNKYGRKYYTTCKSCDLASSPMCEPVANDTCDDHADSIVLRNGSEGEYNFADFNPRADLRYSKGDSCGITGRVENYYGQDAVFVIEGAADQIAKVTLTTLADDNGEHDDLTAFLAVPSTCDSDKLNNKESQIRCVARSREMQNSNAGDKVEVVGVIPTEGKLLLIVDSHTITKLGKFKVKVEVAGQVCENYRGRMCSGDTVLRCNGYGTGWETDPEAVCGGLGCHESAPGQAACNNPGNDSCDAPLKVDLTKKSGVYKISRNIKSFSNDYAPDNCVFHDSAFSEEAVGPDDVYAVIAPKGKIVQAEISHVAGDASFIVYSTSNNICAAGLKADQCGNHTATKTRFIDWYSDGVETTYIVVDSDKVSSTTTQEYEIEFTISDATCDPNVVKCESSTLTRCINRGKDETTLRCHYGCAADQINCAKADNNSCAGLDNSSSKSDFVFTGSEKKNGYIDTSSGSNDFGWEECDYINVLPNTKNNTQESYDLLYKVEGTPGTLVNAKLDLSMNTVFGRDMGLFAFVYEGTEICGGAKPKIHCLAHSDMIPPPSFVLDSDDKDEVSLIIPDSGYFYLVVESKERGNFALDVTYETTKVCTPNQFIECVNDTEVSRCSSDGKSKETIACPGTCDTTKKGCSEDVSNSCADAKELESGKVYIGNIHDYTDQVEYINFVASRCSETPIKRDLKEAVYKVSLTQKQKLTINSLAQFSGYIWVGRSNDACATDISCGTVTELGKTMQLRGDSDTPKEYYIIVEPSHNNVPYGVFELSVEIENLTCVPNAPMSCDAVTKEETLCNHEGTATTTRSCPLGCKDDSSACIPLNDRCDTAYEILEGKTSEFVSGDYMNYQSNLTTAVCNSSYSRKGNEAFYKVYLEKGDEFKLFFWEESERYFYVEFYMTDTCTRLRHNSCLEKSFGSGNWVNFTAPAKGYYYFVIDAYGESQSGDTFHFLATRNKNETCPDELTCTPGQPSYCDNGYVTKRCEAGDSCASAIELTSGVGVSGDFITGNYLFTPPSKESFGVKNACYSEYRLVGKGKYYKITVPNGQTLNATLETTFQYGILVLLENPCTVNKCLALDSRSITWTNNTGSDKTIYLLRDSTSNRGSADTYTLTATVN